MNTKRLALLVGLTGLLALTTSAQPASLSGSANPITNSVTLPPGWSLIANPLFHYRDITAANATPDNSVSAVFPQMPNRIVLLKFDNTTHGFLQENVFRGGRWSNPREKLAPGEGAFLFNPLHKPFAVSFAGNWSYGPVSIPAGLSLISSPGPGVINFAPLSPSPSIVNLPPPATMSRTITATTNSPSVPPIPPPIAGINFNPKEGDVVYTFDNHTGNFIRHRFHNSAWDSLPEVSEGESCFVLTSHPRVIQYIGPLPVSPD